MAENQEQTRKLRVAAETGWLLFRITDCNLLKRGYTSCILIIAASMITRVMKQLFQKYIQF